MKFIATILVVSSGLAAGLSTADYFQAIELERFLRRLPAFATIQLDVVWQVPTVLCGVFGLSVAFLIWGDEQLASEPSDGVDDELVLLPKEEVIPVSQAQARPTTTRDESGASTQHQLRASLAEELEVIEAGLHVLPSTGDQPAIGYGTPIGDIDILAADRDGGLAVIVIENGDSLQAFTNLLAYVGWVKAHVSLGRRVRGLLLAERIDEHVRYALTGIEDIDVYKMRLRFEVERGLNAQ